MEELLKKGGYEVSQDQILGEGHYADINSQATNNEHIVSLCHTATLNAWDRIQELGKELSYILKLYKAHKNSSVTFYRDGLKLFIQGYQIKKLDKYH